MPFKFNPFSGSFDQTGSGGGGASYIDGEVQNFSALPQTIGSPAVDSAYLVREAEGTWLLARKPAGIYIRTANTGVRADDWTYAGEFPDVFSDANFLLYDNGDSTKNLQFQLSGIAAATTRTITMPNANVTLPDQGTSTGDTPTFAKVTINDTVNEQSTLTLSDETHPNKIEFAAEELTLRHTGASDTPYINVTDGTDYALLGVRTGEMFLQGSNAVVRIEKSGGGLADIKVNKLVLEDATSSGEPTATFDADGNLTDNRTYDLPDASGTLALTSDFAAPPSIGNTTPAAGSFTTLSASTSLTLGTSGILSGGTNTIEQRNTTSGQTFRIYNTVSGTADANYERGKFAWESNILRIGTEKLGSGTARALEFQTDGVTRVTITQGGQFRVGEGTAYQTNNRGVFIFTADGVAAIRDWNSTGAIFLRIGTESSSNLFPALKRSSTTLQVRLANDSAFAPFECAGLTLNGDLTASTRNIVTDTTTGTKIGTDPLQKIGFFDKTPVVRPTAVADATDAATVITQLNALLSRMRDLGLIAT